MAIAVETKVRSLRDDFGSGAQVAVLLGVSRSQVTRWLAGGGIDDLNAEKVDLLELVWASLTRLYEPEAAKLWLTGVNRHLGNRRPVDVIRAGRIEDLLSAIRQERAGSYA